MHRMPLPCPAGRVLSTGGRKARVACWKPSRTSAGAQVREVGVEKKHLPGAAGFPGCWPGLRQEASVLPSLLGTLGQRPCRVQLAYLTLRRSSLALGCLRPHWLQEGRGLPRPSTSRPPSLQVISMLKGAMPNFTGAQFTQLECAILGSPVNFLSHTAQPRPAPRYPLCKHNPTK